MDLHQMHSFGLIRGSLSMPDYSAMTPLSSQMATNISLASPHSSIGSPGYPSASKQQKKKGYGVVGRSIEEELCLICGDRASGYHYNALSCEGCKGFFRRSITKSASYVCKYGGQCEMDMWMRRKCQSCRLRRCKEVGMKEECLLSEEQCKARDARRKSRTSTSSKSEENGKQDDNNNDRRERKRTDSSTSSQAESAKQSDNNSICSVMAKHRRISLTDHDFNQNPLEMISRDVRSLIERVVICQDKYEMPPGDSVEKVLKLATCFDPEDPRDSKQLIFTQLAQFTVLSTNLVVEFAKQMPGFNDLCLDDKIILLKNSTCESLMLRTARQYNPDNDTITMADNKSYTRAAMCYAGLDILVPPMFAFCKALADMKLDNAEFGLLTCVSLFSERSGLKERSKVEQVQELYTKALEEYSKAKVKIGNRRFAKLLMTMIDLRELNAVHSEMCLALKVKTGNFPDILLEYFNILQ